MPKYSSNINLEKLSKLSKGGVNKDIKYLNQFAEMIPLSLKKLKHAIDKNDRRLIMLELHFMSPQLLFFGINDTSLLMEKEQSNKGLTSNSLKDALEEAIINIEKAVSEVEVLIKNKSNKPFHEA